MEWLHAFLGLLHSAAGSEDFYVQAARALVDLVKLDSGRILFRSGSQWQEKAAQTRSPVPSLHEWRPSTRVLAGLLQQKKTFWQVPDAQVGASTSGVDAVVAAPILNRAGEVIGALYGERRLDGGSFGSRPLSVLDAMLVEVLAGGVAAGLARVEQEQAALRARLQMEQYFGPGKAAKLVDHPDCWSAGTLRSACCFATFAPSAGSAKSWGRSKTVEWIGDVMSVLSWCVLDHDGVVVDYIGDELMAMWGAPDDQPDHALHLPHRPGHVRLSAGAESNAGRPILGEPLNIGIGINSGIAQVGNVGSSIKFKYGASRQHGQPGQPGAGSTKYLKARLLITEATQAHLDKSFATRRICQVRVVNIAQPVTLFELTENRTEKWWGL